METRGDEGIGRKYKITNKTKEVGQLRSLIHLFILFFFSPYKYTYTYTYMLCMYISVY